MAFDLLIRNAAVPGHQAGEGQGLVDIACANGRIEAVEAAEPGIEAEAGRVIDAGGRLVSPPFVDSHFHMDATLSLGIYGQNWSGTLLEGIELWGLQRANQEAEDIVERALRYCDLAVSQGILAIRSHVDVTDDGLKGVEALLEVRRQVAPYLDLQLVAFPQDGLFRSPGAEANLLRALDMGVDVVGGIPHFERTMADGARSVTRLMEIAAERGLLVDMHCDETDDPMSRHVETLAFESQRLGMAGRVAASHLTSMHSMDNYYVSKLIPLMAEAGLAAIANPLINILIQGRHDTYPKRRGLTRVRELSEARLPVAFGSDCVMDPWYSLGSADMLEVAAMGLHVGQLTAPDDMALCFDAVTRLPAAIMGLEGYGVHAGAWADLVVLQARDPVEAIRTKATRLFVVRRGRVIAETPARLTALSLPGRPASLDPAAYAPPALDDGWEDGPH